MRNGCPWVLCIDVKADPHHDLTQCDLQSQVELLISSGVVLAVGAGPPCSSMSIAVMPPIRSREFPYGKPDLPPPVRAKCRIGNLLANWSAAVYRLCASLDCAVWVENPDASWMWKLRSWKRIQNNSKGIHGELRVDYCRFGTRWRKRTRFAQEKRACAKEGMSIGVCVAYTVPRIVRNWQKRTRGPYALNWQRLAVSRPAGFHCISSPREAVSFMLK